MLLSTSSDYPAVARAEYAHELGVLEAIHLEIGAANGRRVQGDSGEVLLGTRDSILALRAHVE